jgi:hypothetical protein
MVSDRDLENEIVKVKLTGRDGLVGIAEPVQIKDVKDRE